MYYEKITRAEILKECLYEINVLQGYDRNDRNFDDYLHSAISSLNQMIVNNIPESFDILQHLSVFQENFDPVALAAFVRLLREYSNSHYWQTLYNVAWTRLFTIGKDPRMILGGLNETE